MKAFDLAIFREAVAAGRIEWRKHVLQKLAERCLSQQAVRDVLLKGERIRDYMEEKLFPSALFLGYVSGKPLHVVAACDDTRLQVFVITAYEPSLEIFEADLSNKTKIMNSKNEPCPLCGGNKTSGQTTFTADLGSGVVVVRRVQATVCSQCGEEWVDDATALRLEQVVNEARLKHSEVEVTAFA